jgi:branched-chain amino acid transport system ATP-binding protein
MFPRLKEREKQLGGTMSGGEQQMLAIGRGLMSNPKLLLLDEPSLGLSPLFVKIIFEIIQEINKQGVTILLVEQNVFQSLKIANRAYVLETGRVVLSGAGSELLNNDHVKKAFLGM